MKTKTRRPWLAALLSVLNSVVGYAYAGNIKKGVIVYLLTLLLYPALLIFLKIQVTWVVLAATALVTLLIIVGIGADCYRTAKRQPVDYPLKPYNRWWVYIALFVFLGGIVGTAAQEYTRANILQSYKLPSGSMLPTLVVGDFVLVDKKIYRNHVIQHGDIVVFQVPAKPELSYIKRVVALPGDNLEIVNKELFVNGVKQNEGYAGFREVQILPGDTSPRDNFGPVLVPEDHVFVMGDNRDNSLDSRFFGPIPIDKVEGKLNQIYWSWDSENAAVRWERIGTTWR